VENVPELSKNVYLDWRCKEAGRRGIERFDIDDALSSAQLPYIQ